MLFEPMGEVFPDEPMWGARKGDYSYIISEIKGYYYATARRAYIDEPKIEPGKLINIGEFPSMQKAIEACVEWKP
jgi:hypothetical protein